MDCRVEFSVWTLVVGGSQRRLPRCHQVLHCRDINTIQEHSTAEKLPVGAFSPTNNCILACWIQQRRENYFALKILGSNPTGPATFHEWQYFRSSITHDESQDYWCACGYSSLCSDWKRSWRPLREGTYDPDSNLVVRTTYPTATSRDQSRR